MLLLFVGLWRRSKVDKQKMAALQFLIKKSNLEIASIADYP